VTEAEALDKIRAGDVETQIFTPEQFAKILHAAPPSLIPILAIGGFAGMRKAEMDRLDWNAVDLERKMIEVRAGQAKTASRRIIPISDNLLAWLKPLMREGKIVKDNDFHRQITALAGTLKIGWPNNVLRHSFISYRIADVKSADQVALEAGNSPSIIFKHYRELTTEEQANKWFSIIPKEGQWENTIRYDRRTRTVTLPDSEAS
jgi:integrase